MNVFDSILLLLNSSFVLYVIKFISELKTDVEVIKADIKWLKNLDNKK